MAALKSEYDVRFTAIENKTSGERSPIQKQLRFPDDSVDNDTNADNKTTDKLPATAAATPAVTPAATTPAATDADAENDSDEDMDNEDVPVEYQCIDKCDELRLAVNEQGEEMMEMHVLYNQRSGMFMLRN